MQKIILYSPWLKLTPMSTMTQNDITWCSSQPGKILFGRGQHCRTCAIQRKIQEKLEVHSSHKRCNFCVYESLMALLMIIKEKW